MAAKRLSPLIFKFSLFDSIGKSDELLRAISEKARRDRDGRRASYVAELRRLREVERKHRRMVTGGPEAEAHNAQKHVIAEMEKELLRDFARSFRISSDERPTAKRFANFLASIGHPIGVKTAERILRSVKG